MIPKITIKINIRNKTKKNKKNFRIVLPNPKSSSFA